MRGCGIAGFAANGFNPTVTEPGWEGVTPCCDGETGIAFSVEDAEEVGCVDSSAGLSATGGVDPSGSPSGRVSASESPGIGPNGTCGVSPTTGTEAAPSAWVLSFQAASHAGRSAFESAERVSTSSRFADPSHAMNGFIVGRGSPTDIYSTCRAISSD